MIKKFDVGPRPEVLQTNQQQMTAGEANRYNLYLVVLRAEREGLFCLLERTPDIEGHMS